MQQDCTISLERNAMSEGGIRWMYFDAFSSKSSDRNILINTYEQGCSIAFWCRSFTGKEKDAETGYGYFGARYMDHELMTMWLSVDPLADKHPSISPYNYCMWNPIKLVDPDGNDTVKIHLDKGRFEHITSKGDHCIQFYRGKKLIEDETMTISRETCRITELQPQHLQYEQDGDIRVGCTQYLEFSHIASGEAVFRKIAELGAGRDLASMEWDYYELDNRGELSSSGLTDKMVHPADRYKYFSKSCS